MLTEDSVLMKENVLIKESVLIKEKRPAVFLDRDGVLTIEKGYVRSVEEMELFPYAKECVEKIHEMGFYAIVITNPSGIARGLFTESALLEMNRTLMRRTGVDAVYYCPHHWQGTVKKYSHICDCRKPQTGMLAQACREFAIDLEHSVLIGDRACDIRTGKNAGIKTILLESGYGSAELEEAVQPGGICADLREALRICGEQKKTNHSISGKDSR